MEKYNKQNKNYVTTQWRNIINKKNMSTQHRNMSYLLNVKIQNIKTFKRSKKIEDLNKRFRPSN